MSPTSAKRSSCARWPARTFLAGAALMVVACVTGCRTAELVMPDGTRARYTSPFSLKAAKLVFVFDPKTGMIYLCSEQLDSQHQYAATINELVKRLPSVPVVP